MTINADVIDERLKYYKTPEEILGENGLLKQLTRAVLQRALQSEMTVHRGHEKHADVANKSGNARNGSSVKTLKGDFGNLPMDIGIGKAASNQSSFLRARSVLRVSITTSSHSIHAG